ncbi:large conductance mechanosensitive channel protein MscL [Novosphingobium lindaniclasticum]|uniref:Large-conductance mechanosensitive channel n=1 Tax=Novosphingobium lindaniclasticum LE124 TaxID=1096930 RepID=T0H6U8_9SPHN|nr:large conductance mechanosensitive channel protein MscL [Novosphingobium lindaniclasticum]EQB12056.1 large conductance mechanosensitive channel protein MscL [Novosphingobium lindaniclasticum LE124]
MLQEFKTFIARGNVLDLAVGVIIGAAFGKIVSSLTEDVIMPFIGLITGGIDFSNMYIVLGSIPAGYSGPMTYLDLKKAGVALFGYGAFITAVINFLILAFVIFLIVRQANRLLPKKEEAAAPTGPTEVELLAEIRDALKKT